MRILLHQQDFERLEALAAERGEPVGTTAWRIFRSRIRKPKPLPARKAGR